MLLPKEIVHLILQKSSKNTIKNFSLTSHYWYIMTKKYLKYDYILYYLNSDSFGHGFVNSFHKMCTYRDVSSLQNLAEKMIDQYFPLSLWGGAYSLLAQFCDYHAKYLFDNFYLLPKWLYDTLESDRRSCYEKFRERLLLLPENVYEIPASIVKSLFTTLFQPIDLINYIYHHQSSNHGLHFLIRSDDSNINIFENARKD